MIDWIVYLSGEIHSDWREQIINASLEAGLAITFLSPITDHTASDDIGVNTLGPENNAFWHDRKGAGINSIRTQTFIEQADVIVVRFGPQYKQWNAAFDAGYAAALGKKIITLHDEALNHALKEVDAAAAAVAQTPQQVVEIFKYLNRSE